ncbi:hypothetical protein BUALT_Bualt03G0149200 [Buddleja alternifolia]|uniref:DNA polymerase delta subunit 3 n=1 Tax=Buddleja alternifolia TaxID=168488 RepID=A0AAV6Y0I5_9LAMI|nr:hypothetical protein BUALT_Bualt03G0149200 [Buddleja alternifolia]
MGCTSHATCVLAMIPGGSHRVHHNRVHNPIEEFRPRAAVGEAGTDGLSDAGDEYADGGGGGGQLLFISCSGGRIGGGLGVGDWKNHGGSSGGDRSLAAAAPFGGFDPFLTNKEMAEIETLGILDEIQSIVADQLQVVSYKWLSRNFLVSSNAAKRLLQEFVDKHGNGLEVIYSLSGWLKNSPSTYHIRLVAKHKLSAEYCASPRMCSCAVIDEDGKALLTRDSSDAKQEFDGNCSVQVYSVQACVPKDPATLWNHEFVQAEDLFKQPLTADNCLRDNRFCGVSNSFVKRNAGETPLGSGTLQVKTTGCSGSSKSYSAHQATAIPQPQHKKVQQSSSNAGVQSPDIAKTVKTESRVKIDGEQGVQLAPGKEKVPHLLPNKKQGQNDRNSSGTGGALASMWGRASTKSKPDVPLAQADNSRENSSASAEAQISAREAVEYGSSDEDGQDFKIKRSSNGEGTRKRRVVLDYSDEEDEYQDAVSLASPDPVKKSNLCSKESSTPLVLDCNLSFEEKENKPKIDEVKEAVVKAHEHLGEKVPAMNKVKKAESPTSEKNPTRVPESDASMKDKAADAGPKRRKVLKTRIDERGREVTEVVWEGEEPNSKSDSNSVAAADNNIANNAINRLDPIWLEDASSSVKTSWHTLAVSLESQKKRCSLAIDADLFCHVEYDFRLPVARKSPAVGNSALANQPGKAGNKKAGNKDPKQGNILSFFKKV